MDATITQAVKAEARRLGFELVGVTTAHPPAHFEVFERWLARGAHGEMAYLATERSLARRRDPRLILDGCQAIIVVGMRYMAAEPAGWTHRELRHMAAAPAGWTHRELRHMAAEPAGWTHRELRHMAAEPAGWTHRELRHMAAAPAGWTHRSTATGPGGADAEPLPSPPLKGEGVDCYAGEGAIAAYAWGEDYHTVMAERMEALAAFVGERAGRPVRYKVYTDTGPLLERELAQRAGLGWIGKNTCLINPQAGSYFFLGEMLLDVSLEPDAPFVFDRCGSCTRCLEACPTGCIQPDRTIDAKRCISYLTIELKGAIPVDLRKQMGNWIFGCDVCQQVCPWNLRHAADGEWEAGAAEAYRPREGSAYPRLEEELGMTEDEFRRKFKGSPVKRAKRRGYLRNVATAMANAGADMDAGQRERVVEALKRCLEDEAEALVRMHAAWALGCTGGTKAANALRDASRVEQDENVLEEMRAALSKYP